MADETVDMIMPMLREMRAENLRLHRDAAGKFDRVEKRLTKIEETLVSYRHALTSDTLMTRLVTGEFEERIEVLEAKVRELEAHK